MSENDEPIFPRPLQDEEERKKILWETRSKLENEENIFNEKSSCSNCGFINFGQGYFCRNCGSRINLVNFEDLDVPIPVYGPPPMDFNNAETDEIHTTAYGPPPMAFENEKEVIQPIMPVY
ncbi:MAG TPA: hypothetical protein PKE69_15300, partial [Pyrinomonadaceae bacterium]|nr:hypothetical protein [Pyrinomonadaceae bacterium]